MSTVSYITPTYVFFHGNTVILMYRYDLQKRLFRRILSEARRRISVCLLCFSGLFNCVCD